MLLGFTQPYCQESELFHCTHTAESTPQRPFSQPNWNKCLLLALHTNAKFSTVPEDQRLNDCLLTLRRRFHCLEVQWSGMGCNSDCNYHCHRRGSSNYLPKNSESASHCQKLYANRLVNETVKTALLPQPAVDIHSSTALNIEQRNDFWVTKVGHDPPLQLQPTLFCASRSPVKRKST